MAINWSTLNFEKYYKAYNNIRGKGNFFENSVDTDKYVEQERLTMRTKQYLNDKKMLIICDYSCSTDIAKGNVTDRINQGTSKMRAVFEYEGETVIADIELPSKVETQVEISDSKKQEILENAKEVARTNSVFSDNVMHYEELIWNYKHTIETTQSLDNDHALSDNEGSDVYLQGKEMIKAKEAEEADVGKVITVTKGNKPVDILVKKGDIITVRVDENQKPVLNEKGQPIKNVLSKEEFQENYGLFYPNETFYYSSKTSVIMELKPDNDTRKNEEIKVDAVNFDKKQSANKNQAVQLPYEPTSTLEENVKKFAREMKNVRYDLTMGNYTFCTADGRIIDPDLRKLLGQNNVKQKETERELELKYNKPINTNS